MSADTSPAAVAAALAAKKVTPQVPAIPGTAPLGLASTGVTTPPKAVKAPKASPPAKAAKGGKAATLIAFEPGIQTLKLSEIDLSADANLTRPEWTDTLKNKKALTEELAELMASLDAVGQTTPVIVQRVKGGKQPYRMAAGYGRSAALLALGKTTVEARIEVTGTDEARVMVNIVENEDARRATTVLGKLAAVEALAAMGHSIKEVMAIVGHAEDVVRDLMRLNKCDPVLRFALSLPAGEEGVLKREGQKDVTVKAMVWATGRQIARRPVEEQAKLVANCEDMSTEATRAFIAASKLETDPDSKTSSKTSSKKTAESIVYPEARVVKSTIPFIVKYNDAINANKESVDTLEKVIKAIDLKIPPLADALAALEKSHNLFVKAANQQITALTNLLDEKAYNAYLKAALAEAKE